MSWVHDHMKKIRQDHVSLRDFCDACRNHAVSTLSDLRDNDQLSPAEAHIMYCYTIENQVEQGQIQKLMAEFMINAADQWLEASND